jgi:hypothetical protein
MQLRFNRTLPGIALILLCAVDWAVIAIAMHGLDIVYAMGAMAALFVVAMIPLLMMARPPVIAGIEGDMLRVGRQRAHLGDILRTSINAGTLSFAVRARDENGFWVGAYGERDLALPLRRIDGGRKAAEHFVAQVAITRQSVPELVTEAPPAPAPAARPRRDGVDPDVRPALDHPAAPPPVAARGGFGRKGL